MTPATLRLAALGIALDRETVRLCDLLAAAGVPVLLLKGPALQRWLYPGEHRAYGDIDLLVPHSRQAETLKLLATQGYLDEAPELSRLETAQHARTLVAASGLTVDLHTRLHTTTQGGDVVWEALSTGAQAFPLAGGEVRVCGLVQQLLIVVLHAAQHGMTEAKPIEDLRRAGLGVTDDDFHRAAILAEKTGAAGSFAAGLRLDATLAARLPDLANQSRNLLVKARAAGGHQVPGVLVLARVRAAGWPGGVPIVARALWPTSALLRNGIDPAVSRRTGWLLRARLGRAGYQARQATRAVRALRGVHRAG